MPEWARKKGIVGTYKEMCKNLVGGWSCAKETGSKCLLITFKWMSTGVKEGDPGRFGASGQSQRPPLLWAGRPTAAFGFTFFNLFKKYGLSKPPFLLLQGEEHLHPWGDVLHSKRAPDADTESEETRAEGVLQGQDRGALQQRVLVKAGRPHCPPQRILSPTPCSAPTHKEASRTWSRRFKMPQLWQNATQDSG